MKTLNLGCGLKKIEGTIGADINSRSQADLICDFNQFPYPFSDNAFDKIICVDVIEHLEDIIKVMEEIYRIAKNNARVYIRVPHFSSTLAYGDPTHKHYFNSQSFNYFFADQPDYNFYSKARFIKAGVNLQFWKLHEINGVSILANKFTNYYEKLFAFIFPAMNLEFNLIVQKEPG